MNSKLIRMLLFSVAILFTQCKNSGDVVQPDDENELITSVTLTFTEQGTSNVSKFSYKDADGDGGNVPTQFDSVILKANTTYTLAIELLDESKSPIVDVTKEVADKSDEHLFVYTPTPSSLLSYTYGDKDVNNYPIGLTGTAVSGTKGIGKLKVQLRHQPGAKNGTASPGSDDVNLDFNVGIK